MLRKGVVKNITSMVVILMAGGVVATTLGGPLYNAMDEGYSEIQQFLGIADRTELSDEGDYTARQELAAIAHYAWDRAHSCDYVSKVIDSGGYDGLKDTSYGTEPPCSGQSGTLMANFWSNLLGNSGNDMEGKFSRIEFEVKDRVVLETSKEYGVSDGWEGNEYKPNFGDTPVIEKKGRFQPWAVSRNGETFQERIAEKCGDSSPTGGLRTPYKWPVVFSAPESDVGDSRFNFYDSFDWRGAEEKASNTDAFRKVNKINTEPFCQGSGLTGGAGYLVQRDMDKYWNGEKGRTEMVLCPGDEGYLQVNKGSPQNDGEFTKSDAGINYYPYIQITEVNDSRECETSNPQIPEDANSQGSNLELSANKNADSINIDDFRLTEESRSTCRVSVTEKDPVFSENGHVDYRPGAVLPKSDKFPSVSSDAVVDYELKEADGFGEDYGTKELYEFFSKIHGLDGRAVDSDNAPLLNDVGGKSLDMYGDLLCVQNSQDFQQPEWVACDESVGWLDGRENHEVSINSDTTGFPLNYRCNMQSGKWELHSTGRTCESIRRNGKPSEKIDVVFYGGQFDSVDNLASNASYLVDWNGNNQGLMSLEPFSDNRERFNFWAVNSSNPIPLDSSNSGAFDRRNALLTPRLACGAERTDEVVVLSRREGRSYAFQPGNATAGGSWDREAYVYIGNQVQTQEIQLSQIFLSGRDMERRIGVTPDEIGVSLDDTIQIDNDDQNDPRTFAHEFGHSFGGLADEYTEAGGDDRPNRPNCADNREEAENWWEDMASNSDGVDYFDGCMYVNSNIRPTIMSVMNIQFFESYDFEPVNERRINRVIDNYNTGEGT